MTGRKSILRERVPLIDSLEALMRADGPSPGGWWKTLGYLLLFLIFLQALTGLLLAFFYAPTPDHAWESLYFLEDEVDGGRLLRSLHVRGMSWIVILVLIHGLRAIVEGSYRRPREVTWMSGVALFLVLLGFSLTGFLLPWHQGGYWGTVIATRMLDSVPWLGTSLAATVRGGQEVGALTLTRFYALHVGLLPLLLAALTALHGYLVWRHGHFRGRGQGVPLRQEGFFPYQAFRISLTWFAAFVMLLLESWLIPARLGFPADPSGIDYDPRPVWFLLPHYELLRLFEGSTLLPALLIPLLFATLIFLFPLWIEALPQRGKVRKVVAVTAFLFLVALAGTVVYSKLAHPPRFGEDVALKVEDLPLPAGGDQHALLQGRQLLIGAKCINCHRINDLGGRFGPDLSQIGKTSKREEIREKILDPRKADPGSKMPSYRGKFTAEELNALLDYLDRLGVSPTPAVPASDLRLLHTPQ